MSQLAATNGEIEMKKWMNGIIENVNLASEGSGLERQKYRSSIYKVPPHVLNLDKAAYIPQVVSFGPYQSGNPQLKSMEVHKERALVHFLRSLEGRQTLDGIYHSLLDCVDELKDSYDSLSPEWRQDTNRFLQLMIVDGCFMLEILNANSTMKKKKRYSEKDPVFGAHGKIYVIPFIKTDMLMIENQLKNACSYQDRRSENTKSSCFSRFRIIDIFNKKEDNSDVDSSKIMRSAVELQEAGIQFKKSKTKSLTDISFSGDILRLPQFTVDDTTKSTYLNLVAFERCHVDAGHEVTAFICFMDRIIDRDPDIHILSDSNIICNLTGSDKEAAIMFNTITQDFNHLTVDEPGPLKTEVVKYCRNGYHRQRANLVHTYFQSPWSTISLFAAIFPHHSSKFFDQFQVYS
ncbi:UPF0481 protein At3g47200-like [Impatiens glandulifera]|uniref:UPF0481 protein At3g47200-like n=1 Tax=Impatiens glandulifera TaxID=253017 RepID=UPI001FB0F06E|nr:UPF0481 protein At3g47200-like [Impatiens glandulifera]